MATASFSAMAKDDLSCPICFEILTDPNTPKLLDCPHVCCAVCIRKLAAGGKDTVECAECRQLTRIPDGGVDDMRTVLRVRSLAEKHQELINKSVQNAFQTQEEKNESIVPSTCPDHCCDTVDYFCKNCNIIGCNICMKECHSEQSHNVLKVQAARDEQREQMNCIINRVLEKMTVFRKSAKNLDDLKTDIEGAVQSQCQLIDTRAKYAIEKINEECKFVKACFRKKAVSRLDMITQERNLLDMEVQEFMETIATVRNTIDETDPHELVVKHGDLAQAVYSLMDKKLKVYGFGNPVFGMTKYDEYKKPLDMREIIYNIFPVKKLTCEFVAAVDSFRLVDEIVANSLSSFVVHDAKKHKVYNIEPNHAMEYYKESQLPKLYPNYMQINGIAVTSGGQYLIAREYHIDVYSPSRKYEGQFKFRDEQKGVHDTEYRYATKIAVMTDGTERVVIGDEHNSTLIIVSKNQVVLRTFQISITPMRICSMSNGMVAVSNWRAGKISVIDIETGKEMHFLKIPHVLAACYHPPLDCFLVLRNTAQDENKRELQGPGVIEQQQQSVVTGKGVIEQYCVATGRFLGIVAGGLYLPQDLAISNDLRLLAVADSKSVRVFRIA